MHSHDMKVETPLRCSELEDRSVYTGHEDRSQCSSCGVGPRDPWYPVADIMVIRHWTKKSVDVPGGGMWWWYCTDHFTQWNGRWWPNSDLAPAHLLPEIVHHCEQPAALGSTCGDPAGIAISGVWTCDRHAEAARVERRIRELMADPDELDS